MSTGHSLRFRLLASVTAASAVVLLASGVALYLLVRTSLLKEMYSALLQQAQVMASMFEWKDGQVDLELDQLAVPAKAAPDSRQFVEVWQEGRGLLARSASLAGSSLAQRAQVLAAPRWSFVRLASGRRARMVTLTVRPTVDGAGELSTQPPVNQVPRVTLLLASDLGRYDRSLESLVILLVAVGLAAMLASAGGAWWAVGFGLRPLAVLGQRLTTLDEASLHSRVELPQAPRELLAVVTRLNQLLSRLEAAFGREKALLANLAHELRTPLAGMGFTLEVGLSRPRPAQDYAADMRQCLDICQQMQGMVDNLLTMARLDAGQGAPQGARAVALEGALAQAWTSLQDQAAHKGLGVDWQVSSGLSALADPHGLLVILRNLLSNAVDYADQGGLLWVSASKGDGLATISVTNTGSRLSVQDMDHVFERFWRGDSSRSGEQAHAGLGLALARQMAEAMHGSLEARQDEPGRFCITLSLPSATDQEGQTV